MTPTPPPADAKLLPCPFCGFEANLFREVDPDGVHHRVRCANRSCRAEQCLQVDHAEYIKELRAVTSWNTRATPPAAPAGDIAKFQDEVRNLLLDLLTAAGLEGTDIDGGGCDSGDWRDFTMSEIRQGFNGLADYYHDRNEEQAKEIAALRAEVERLRGERDEARNALRQTVIESDNWRHLFGDVARSLKCLPSCFVSQNDHVRCKAERLQAELAGMRGITESAAQMVGVSYAVHRDETVAVIARELAALKADRD
jgi:hypothetical protein